MKTIYYIYTRAKTIFAYYYIQHNRCNKRISLPVQFVLEASAVYDSA